MSGAIDELRARIDSVDRTIMSAVNERLRLVEALWETKRAQGTERLDPGREAALRAALADANTGPLSAEGLDRLVDVLLDLMRTELEPQRNTS